MCYVEEHEEAPKTTHVWQGKKNLQRRTVISFKLFFVKSPWCKYKERRSLDCRGQRSQKSENQKLRIKTSSQIPGHNTHLKASQDKEAKRLGIWYLVNWPFQESVMTNWENILYFRTLTLSRTCLGWQPWEGRDNNNKEATWGQDSRFWFVNEEPRFDVEIEIDKNNHWCFQVVSFVFSFLIMYLSVF